MAEKLVFPRTSVGGIEVSRMLCGSNPFFGFSHFTHARDEWLKGYFSVARIVEVMEKCSEFGIDGTVSGTKPRLHEAIQTVEKTKGVHFKWFCTPTGETLEELKEGIDWCADHGVEFCMPHPSWTDLRVLRAENRIVDLPEVCEHVRKKGMVPGVSTHRPETIRVCDIAGYDVEVYIQPLNSLGFLCSLETDWVARIIREAKHPVLVTKPLAAGRLQPHVGLPFVYRNVKPADTVAVGFLSPGEVEEDVRIAMQELSGIDAQLKMTESRSKRVVL